MIQSMFVVNLSGEVCLEKHWVRVTSKTVCDAVSEASVEATTTQQPPPVTEVSNANLCHIIKNDLFFVAVFVNEILWYNFGNRNSKSTNFSDEPYKSKILDEMLDGGFPLATEPNILREIVRPPNLLKTLTDAMVGKNSMVSSVLPACQLSNVRWRRSGVKYTNNELYFDMIETIEGMRLFAVGADTGFGSGVPDLTLAFSNHRLIDDASLHPCVRFLRWKRERVLSFIPPDGHFCLMNYERSSLIAAKLILHTR
ncbi:unnamed protein product [Echinostoma caproni]|uniref:MHD domain-containing protein n=1 Tax=Echinostoma caproni TaxID=27848 RepID=A0A183ANW3_9TREM|nr:unnamed protein product [Echinostoma caproni]